MVRAQLLQPRQQQPPPRRRPHAADRRLRPDAPRQIRPPRWDLARTPIHKPADHGRLATPLIRAPAKHPKLDIAQLPRRRDQPHPLRQRIHNMSSATTTRPITIICTVPSLEKCGRRRGSPADTPQSGRCHAPMKSRRRILGRRRATRQKPVRPQAGRQAKRVSPPPPGRQTDEPDDTDRRRIRFSLSEEGVCARPMPAPCFDV